MFEVQKNHTNSFKKDQRLDVGYRVGFWPRQIGHIHHLPTKGAIYWMRESHKSIRSLFRIWHRALNILTNSIKFLDERPRTKVKI